MWPLGSWSAPLIPDHLRQRIKDYRTLEANIRQTQDALRVARADLEAERARLDELAPGWDRKPAGRVVAIDRARSG